MSDIDKGTDKQVIDGDADAKAAADKAIADAKGGDDDGAKGDKTDDSKGDDKNWTSSLDEDVRQDPSITKFKNPNDMAKSYKHLESKLGKDKIVKPQDTWTENEWNEFYDSTGRPKDSKEYKLTEVELPEGMESTGEDMGVYKDAFHKAGLSQKQADGLYQNYVGVEKLKFEADIKTATEAKENAQNQLRKDWGKAYDKNIKLAETTFMSLADTEAKELFVKEGFGNNPSIIRMFAKIGAERSEDNIGEGKREEGVLTPDEANKKIAEVNGNKEHPYWIKGHPEQKFAKEQMEAWYAMAHPEEKSDVVSD